MMLSSQNVAIVKIPFRSRVMGFSNNRLFFVLMGKGIFDWHSGTGEPLTLHHEQTISGEEMHALTTSMISVMASDIVDGL